MLIQRRTVGGTRFTTFRTLKSSSTGTFKTPSFKATSTQYYRARVAQTDACEGAQSPRVRVTVGKTLAAARKAAQAAKARR